MFVGVGHGAGKGFGVTPMRIITSGPPFQLVGVDEGFVAYGPVGILN